MIFVILGLSIWGWQRDIWWFIGGTTVYRAQSLESMCEFAVSVRSKLDDYGNALLVGSSTISAQPDNTDSRWDTNLNAVVLRYDHVRARQRM